MRIPSGVTDQFLYFVAVDSTDYVTRETGLSSFTVYRSRNGAAAVAYTTPTINETDSTNMPGVYELLLDEDMTIDAGDDSQEVVVHITHAGMAPVTRSFELYRPKITAGETLTCANGAGDADIERIQGTVVNTPSVAGVLEVDVTHFNGVAGTFAAGRPEVNTTHAAGTAWGSGAITAASIATGAITNAKFAAGAIDAAAIAADAIGASELAADAVTEIVTGVWNAATATYGSAGSYGELIETNLNATVSSRASQTSLDTLDDYVDTEVAAIKTKTDFLPSAAAGAAGGLLIAGSNAATTFATLTVSGATTLTGNVSLAAGLTITQSTLNGHGITVTGNGNGEGVRIEGGATGNGMEIIGGATSGRGLYARVQGGNLPGIQADGFGTGSGMLLNGGDDGAGFTAFSGSTSGIGMVIGGTYQGMYVSSGNGFSGMVIDGGSGVQGDGLEIISAGTGVDVRADITGNITGNLSGSVGSVTNAVTVGAMNANTLTAAALAADAVTEIQTGLSTLSSGDVATAVWNAATATYGAAGSYGLLVETNLDATVSSRLATASYTAPLDAAGTRTAVGLAAANLDTQLSTIDTVVDAVKLKTDGLTYTVAGQVDANIQYVNDVLVNGTGALGDEWGP